MGPGWSAAPWTTGTLGAELLEHLGEPARRELLEVLLPVGTGGGRIDFISDGWH